MNVGSPESDMNLAHPWHHCISSSEKYGGQPKDYLPIHHWFDESKSYYANFRHRALRHHAQGIFEAEKNFGHVVVNSDGKSVPTRFIAEQHVREDCGGLVPSIQDWFSGIPAKRWMSVGKLEDDSAPEAGDVFINLSLEIWRSSVARGETLLGYLDWKQRMKTLRHFPESGIGEVNS
jgi:hypothetical protein